MLVLDAEPGEAAQCPDSRPPRQSLIVALGALDIGGPGLVTKSLKLLVGCSWPRRLHQLEERVGVPFDVGQAGVAVGDEVARDADLAALSGAGCPVDQALQPQPHVADVAELGDWTRGVPDRPS